MTKPISTFLFLFLMALPVQATEILSGQFKVLNTAGFIEDNGIRTPLEASPQSGSAEIRQGEDMSLVLTIGGTEIRLFPMENGLDAFDWNASETALLHEEDIEALNRGEVPAWGAELAWQGLGKVKLALLPLGDTAYTGFLVSHPQDKTVVRQMEFRQVLGPANRPRR